MTPFIGTPENFSPETLELLDRALLEMWHEQQAKTAAALEAREQADRKQAPIVKE